MLIIDYLVKKNIRSISDLAINVTVRSNRPYFNEEHYYSPYLHKHKNHGVPF